MSSRALAAAILTRVIGEGKSLTAALDEYLPQLAKDNDRAFVQALSYGVLRWYGRLEAILEGLISKPIRDGEIHMLALVGLFQLEYTRVKPYAAVAETVAAAGRKAWAKSLLNGVLRNFQRRRDELVAAADARDTARLSHPLWLLERIRADWPDRADALMEHANEQAPLTLRVNRRLQARDDYLALLAEAGYQAQPTPISTDGIVLAQAVAVDRLPGFAEGRVSVQDEAAQLAAALLDVHPGQRVLDICAAPGGKTLHLLETADPRELVAVDVAPDRLALIHQNLRRAGLSATVLAGDGAKPEWWDGEVFDRILLDAPCSATGVIRRHPDIKWLRLPEDIGQLAAQQTRILDAMWTLLKPEGRLLYATCSILREENDGQIAAFLQRHPDAREVPIAADWGQAMGCGRQILTGKGGMDGFYYAMLLKDSG